MLANEFYLVLYGIIFGSSLIACRFVVNRADQTDKIPTVPARLDSYELAYLRGGREAVERLAILELLEGGYLVARQQEASFWRSRPARIILERVRERQDLSWYLSAALRRFATPQVAKETSDLWGDQWPRLQAELEERLNKDQMLVTEKVKSVSRTATATSFILLTALLVPIFPVLFDVFKLKVLWILPFLGCLLAAACDASRLSKRGKAYLALLQNTLRGKQAAALPSSAAAAVSFTVMFEFALLGAESLKDTPYEGLDDIFDSGDSGDGGDGGGDD